VNKTLWEKARRQALVDYGIDYKTKRETLVNSAVNYTTMLRVFKPRSKERICRKLQEVLCKVKTTPYEKLHREFCHWFAANIKRAKKYPPASYGEAAKTFDVAMKFLVGFCRLPNERAAQRLMPKLHCGIDRLTLRHLKSKCSSLVELDDRGYKELQTLLNQEASGELPVVYDEVLRQRLLRAHRN